MSKLNKAIKHYYKERCFTKELLIGVENELPGTLSSRVMLDSLDNRDIVDDGIYNHLLDVQLEEMRKYISDEDE